MKKQKSSRAKKDLDDPYFKGTSSLDLKSDPPSQNLGKLLPLNEVHDKDFEIICVSLLEEEPEVASADLKRKDGVSQFGIDAEGFADHEADFDLDVLSAKCYQKIIPSHLKTWGDDFLKHLDEHWKDKNICRFILSVTVELTRGTIKKQIALEEKRFHAKGIKYEIWGLRQLEAKLRNHRAVIERYFHPGWADRICGKSTSEFSSETGRLYFHENVRLKNELNSERLKKLKEELKNYNSGHPSSMGEVIDSIRSDQSLWSSLGDEDKTYVLRADIIQALNKGDVIHAKKVHDECKPLLPPDADKDLPAYIAYMKGNITEALNILEAPASIREKTMRCSLLIELGEIEQALDELKALPKKDKKSAEVRRIQGIALAKLGKDKKALKHLGKQKIWSQQTTSSNGREPLSGIYWFSHLPYREI